MEDQRGTTGTRVSCLRRCDERTRINTCVNKSLVQTLESCPSSDASAVLPTLIPSIVKIRSHAGLVNAYGQPKIGCNTPRAI